MKTAERSLANRSLSEAAVETIDVLHQHRLLTTSPLGEMVLPGRSLRRMQQVLAELARGRLADWVAARGAWPGPAERVWFLTKRGGAVVDAVPNKAEPRLRLVSPEQASVSSISRSVAAVWASAAPAGRHVGAPVAPVAGSRRACGAGAGPGPELVDSGPFAPVFQRLDGEDGGVIERRAAWPTGSTRQ